MSFQPLSWRPLARAGWGGVAEFRGLLAIAKPIVGISEVDSQQLGADHWGQIGSLFGRSPGGVRNSTLVGVAYTSAGSPAVGAKVDLHVTGGDFIVATVLSDASGNFRFDNPGTGPFYIVAYLAGNPDRAGSSVNTLRPT